jgi:hypothetical protein
MWAVIVTTDSYSQSYPEVTNLGYPPDLPINGFGMNTKTSLKADQNGALWYSSLGLVFGADYIPGGVVQYSNGNWNNYHTGNSPLPSDSVYCLMPFGQKMYIGTAHGLAILDENWQIIDQSNGLPNNHVRSLFITEESLYVGTNQGLAVYSDNNWLYYATSNSGICNDVVLSLEMDGEGKLWIGTADGLCSFKNDIWDVYNTQNSGLLSNEISALKTDTRGNLWIGTTGSGLHSLSGSIIRNLSQLYDYPMHVSQHVSSILLSESGDIYAFIRLAGLYYKLMKIAPERAFIYDYPASQGYLAEKDGLLYFTRSNARELFSFNTSLANLHDEIGTLETSGISADFSSSGRIGWTLDMHDRPQFEIPAGSGKSTVFTGRLWIGGKSETNQLHLAGERFSQQGFDFWPGPVSSEAEMSQAEKEKWFAVWKISLDEIEYHRTHWYETSYEMPYSIALWPAHGDTLLGQSRYIAPYMDMNGNGVYEPLSGDYPVIRGDKAVFFVFNDMQEVHSETGGLPLGVEIHGMAYAFEAPNDSALKHAVFVNYQILNRSENDYDSLYLANFVDLDLGDGIDDFVGCDTTTSSYFVYNGSDVDGNGETYTYGAHPPSQAVTFLNKPMTSFIYFNNSSGSSGDPQQAPEYYNYLQAKWKNGQPLVYGGSGYPGLPGSGTERVYHMFPDDPNLTEGWNEIIEGNPPGDRRGLASSYIGSFPAGESICYDLAFVFGRDYEGNNLTSVTKMKAHIDQVREFYAQNFDNNCIDLISTGSPEVKEPSGNKIRCYPNPVDTYLNFEYKPVNINASFTLYNVLGKVLASGKIIRENNMISTKDLSSGMYILQVEDGVNRYQQKIIKR